MMPEVFHLSRDDGEKFTFDRPFVVIAVRDPGSPPVEFAECPSRLAVLEMEFHDLDYVPPEISLDGLIPYTKDHAREIIQFVQAWREKADLILFTCEAGLSRSAALAAAVAYGLLSRWHVPRKGVPNRRVFLETITSWQ